jgi:predicted Zn-dependent peptidase
VSRFLWSVGAPEALLPPAGASLDRIEFQDLLDFKRRVIRPEGSTLLLYGDLNLTQAKQLALMHLGIWQPSVQAPLKGLPPRAADKPAPRLLAVLEPSPATELWAGAPRPLASAPAVDALLPILLARWSRRQFGSLGMTFTLAQDARTPLLIKARVPSAERDGLVPGFMAALASLRRGGLSEQDLAFAVVQWKAENAALALHPEPLLRDLADGRLDPGLAQAVDRLTLTEVSQALQSWLDPDRLRYLLLGADAPMLQAAEKAGLAPSMVMGD